MDLEGIVVVLLVGN